MAGRDGIARRGSESAEPRGGVWKALFSGRQAGWGGMAVVSVAVAGALLLWSRFSNDVRLDNGYGLEPAGITVTGIAPWVRSDLKGEALRNASLDGRLPLDDPELPRRLARAFDMHPWVRQVVRVELGHPAQAFVEVACREPIAMISVPGGLLAIDAEGVVLPSGDFTAEDAARYPRVVGVRTSPQGPEGSPWGDPLVEEAAALAVAIGPEWSALNLVECRVGTDQGRRGWMLLDDAGRAIRFGSAPGREVAGEPSAAAKVARLQSLGAGECDVDLTVASLDEQQPATIPE